VSTAPQGSLKNKTRPSFLLEYSQTSSSHLLNRCQKRSMRGCSRATNTQLSQCAEQLLCPALREAALRKGKQKGGKKNFEHFMANSFKRKLASSQKAFAKFQLNVSFHNAVINSSGWGFPDENVETTLFQPIKRTCVCVYIYIYKYKSKNQTTQGDISWCFAYICMCIYTHKHKDKTNQTKTQLVVMALPRNVLGLPKHLRCSGANGFPCPRAQGGTRRALGAHQCSRGRVCLLA